MRFNVILSNAKYLQIRFFTYVQNDNRNIR